jgi:uncharacterized protein YjiS (DUF1127 family)
MAFVSNISSNQSNGFKAAFKGLDGLKIAFVRGMDAYIERHSRSRQIESLNAMSDEQLATIGVKRDQITRHVFRDQLYI